MCLHGLAYTHSYNLQTCTENGQVCTRFVLFPNTNIKGQGPEGKSGYKSCKKILAHIPIARKCCACMCTIMEVHWETSICYYTFWSGVADLSARHPRARSARGGGRINRNTTTKGVIKCLLPLIGRCGARSSK